LKYRELHDWNVTPREAKELQYKLKEMIEPVWDNRSVGLVAAADVGFPDKHTVMAAVVVLTWPDLRVIETKVKTQACTFPYVPGLLAFREVPGLLAVLAELDSEPDVLMCDAQGIAHRQRMGLATHVGILLERPVIGCAKSVLYGKFEEPGEERGSISYMFADSGEVIGAAVRTRRRVKPVYVSVGNRIDLDTAVEMILACSPKYRIPEPLRLAHKLSVGENVVCDAAEEEEGSLFCNG
jgi:deoxyribonuclease V